MKTFTEQQVKDILFTVYEFYDIANADKFRELNLSNCQDAPSDERIMRAEEEDIESFIF